ncbi:restriction endonuclease subunit S [uncultured Clostridium sp.]|uniref:restriction endonuclease subunit S n=1 Tax=uncultured Clostridium sp. TaxID=59620 RepID=UPI002594E86F|nr:restriction endonuclease subunit S [uncultured Clostridium sp.]
MKAQDLKNSVLQLAMQGKLVEQNPNYEPASALLEKIKAEKEQRIKEKKIKREKPLPEISEEEKPFEIPDTWEWIRHNDIFEISGGSQPAKSNFIDYEKEGYIRLYQTRDYGKSPQPVYIPVDMAKKISQKGDILLARYGASLGKVFLAEDGAYNVALAKVIPLFDKKLIDNRFLFWYYKSSIYQEFVSNRSRSAQAGFNKEDLNSLLFPLPPLEEQKRIVVKIEEVLEKIEEYDKAEKELSELEKAFPQDMKKSILQYAIQGKLVEQNPSDEAASVLLEKLKAEKEKLINEKKIKKEKQLPEISEEEKYFEIPQNWKWVRLNDICSYIQRGKSPKYSEVKEIPVIAQKCVQWSGVDLSKAKFIEPETIKKYSDERILKQGDLLWNSTGLGTLGRINMFVENEKYKTIVADSHVTVIRAFKELVDYKYLFYWFSGPIVQGEVESKSTGSTKQMELGTTTIKEYLVPLPPLEEQKRIVEKIEKLLSYVDRLQNRIDNENLINKIVKAKSIELSESKELINN